MKIVINKCFGGFSISLEAARWMAEHGSTQARAEVEEHTKKQAHVDHFLATGKWPEGCTEQESKWLEIDAKYGGKVRFHGFGYGEGFDGYDRTDPLLVQAVETLGEMANGENASLKVVTVPDGVDWEIDEYDGNEHIAEKHNTWS